MEKMIQLSSTLVLQMLGDHDFYRACPTYLFMMENGLAISKQFQELVQNQRKCPSCTEKSIIGTLGTFAIHTRLISRFDARLLVPFVEYLQRKLGYELGTVSLYYKDGSNRQKDLRFGPRVAGYVQDVFVEQGGSDGQVHRTPPDAASAGAGGSNGPGVPAQG